MVLILKLNINTHTYLQLIQSQENQTKNQKTLNHFSITEQIFDVKKHVPYCVKCKALIAPIRSAISRHSGKPARSDSRLLHSRA